MKEFFKINLFNLLNKNVAELNNRYSSALIRKGYLIRSKMSREEIVSELKNMHDKLKLVNTKSSCRTTTSWYLDNLKYEVSIYANTNEEYLAELDDIFNQFEGFVSFTH